MGIDLDRDKIYTYIYFSLNWNIPFEGVYIKKIKIWVLISQLYTFKCKTKYEH